MTHFSVHHRFHQLLLLLSSDQQHFHHHWYHGRWSCWNHCLGIAQPHYLIRSSSCCRWHHHHDCRHVINNNIIITITLSSSSTFAIDGTATARNERNHMIVVLSPLLLGFLVCSSFRCPSSHTHASLQSRFQLRFLPHTRSPFPLAAVGSGHNEIRWVSARVIQIGGCTNSVLY